MLIHTNNVAAGAITEQFSLSVHPKLPEDKHLRTGGNDWQFSNDRSRLQNKDKVEVYVPGVSALRRNNLRLWQLQIWKTRRKKWFLNESRRWRRKRANNLNIGNAQSLATCFSHVHASSCRPCGEGNRKSSTWFKLVILLHADICIISTERLREEWLEKLSQWIHVSAATDWRWRRRRRKRS